MDAAMPLGGTVTKAGAQFAPYPEGFDICQNSSGLPPQNPQTLNRASNQMQSPGCIQEGGRLLFILSGNQSLFLRCTYRKVILLVRASSPSS